MAFLLYNMEKANIFDPTVYENFERAYKTAKSEHMLPRVCFGALHAYYKTNQGTKFGIDFWESLLEDHIDGLHAQEMVELMVAFRDNR